MPWVLLMVKNRHSEMPVPQVRLQTPTRLASSMTRSQDGGSQVCLKSIERYKPHYLYSPHVPVALNISITSRNIHTTPCGLKGLDIHHHVTAAHNMSTVSELHMHLDSQPRVISRDKSNMKQPRPVHMDNTSLRGRPSPLDERNR